MKVNFILKGSNNPTNIIVRFKPTQANDFTCVTGLWIDRNEWNEQKQQLKQRATTTNKDLINSKLKELEGEILDRWTRDYINKSPISTTWLKDVVSVFFGKSKDKELNKIYFVDWVADFIDNAPKRIYKGKTIKAQTIKLYKSTYNKLTAYETHTKTKLRFEHIDMKFYNNFLTWCQKDLMLGRGTIGTYIKHIKVWCRLIELDGLPINQQFKHSEFMVLNNKTKDTYLNEAEITAIYNHDFSHSDRLDNARDLFIIGLQTGLRVSDFLSLKPENLKNGYIYVEQTKTGADVQIPIHGQIQSILDKRNGALPRSITDQKFNEYIKEICKIVGIDEMTEGAKMNPETKRKETGVFPKYELISSHTCRRSFASNYYGKLPNGVIMAITGHQTEAMFLKYIKITKAEHAETLKTYWANEQKEKGYTTVLRKVE